MLGDIEQSLDVNSTPHRSQLRQCQGGQWLPWPLVADPGLSVRRWHVNCHSTVPFLLSEAVISVLQSTSSTEHARGEHSVQSFPSAARLHPDMRWTKSILQDKCTKACMWLAYLYLSKISMGLLSLKLDPSHLHTDTHKWWNFTVTTETEVCI